MEKILKGDKLGTTGSAMTVSSEKERHLTSRSLKGDNQWCIGKHLFSLRQSETDWWNCRLVACNNITTFVIRCYTKPWKLRERYTTGGIIQLTVLCHCSEKIKVHYENKSGSCWNHMKDQSENLCSRWSAMIQNSGKSCWSGKIIAGMNHHVLLDDRDLIPAAIISGSLFLIPYSKA